MVIVLRGIGGDDALVHLAEDLAGQQSDLVQGALGCKLSRMKPEWGLHAAHACGRGRGPWDDPRAESV